MPLFDSTPLLAEDEAVNNLDIPFRFGKGFDTNLSLKDGKWTNTSSGRIWSLKVTSRGAYSINFIFDELHLSEGAELSIYNEKGENNFSIYPIELTQPLIILISKVSF